MGSSSGSNKGSSSKGVRAPKGTRDLYPEDAARTRYIQKAWTDTAVRHGFDEIEGPTFEHSDLYAVKSGEGILGELFQAFSGKDPAEIEEVQKTGRAPFALRPEFTPTLARMYAARAKQLNKPTKWFTAGPYFRAERPQRGRLREFLQWNCDVIGDSTYESDRELMCTCVGLFEHLGLTVDDVRLQVSDRDIIADALQGLGVAEEHVKDVLQLIDRRGKIGHDELVAECGQRGLKINDFDEWTRRVLPLLRDEDPDEDKNDFLELEPKVPVGDFAMFIMDSPYGRSSRTNAEEPWFAPDLTIVRGLAYYTGTVFEAIADGERAVAGGGRYDNLIELMGGRPTPAVGFAMGDVVLGLLLEDKGLIPEGAELLDAISAPGASRRPEVFVLGADDEASDPLVRRLVADLRRGGESDRHSDDAGKPWSRARFEAASGGVRPMHARQSYKSTRNLNKLLSDAERQYARFAAVVHGEDRVQLRDLDRRAEITPKDAPGLPDDVAEFSVDPASPVYVGRAIAAMTA